MILLAFDNEGHCISIVNAKSKEIANAFWQGKGLVVHTIKSLEEDFISLEEHPSGVYEIVQINQMKGSLLNDYTSVGRSGRLREYYLV